LGVISFFETHAEDEIALGCAIESAAELGDTESAKRVITCIDLGTTKLPSKRVLQDALKFLRKQAQGDCAGWLDWAARAALEPWAGVFQSVSENSNVWSTEWCDNADLSEEFSLNLIEAFSGPNSLLLQQSMAFVLELVGENSSRSSISEIRSAALNILVNLEMSNAQIRNAFVSLISSYEDGNISTNDYVELLDAAILVWGAYGAVSSFAWFLDVIDQILLLPSLDKRKLQELISLSYSSLQSFGSNIDTSLHNLFCEIAEPFMHLERRSVDVENIEDNKWTKFHGLKIGIYSLLESLPDLKAKLEALCPSADFRINQEKVGSNELRSFASSCDLVLIHTSKAKHAATEVLNEAITGERIYVAGRGRGSIINTLLSWNPSDN
jgi:hypothetical protein